MPSWRTARTHPARSGTTSADAESARSSPQPSDQVGHRLRRGRAGGRPPTFDAEAYKQRNAVERCINRLKQWRGLAMRTDKLAIAHQAALHLAAILIWARR
ncbi:transposase [Streptomyces sp. NPDC059566]|uniref:transposase n=1 Tax=unclassified Streptomyces TaxID=2593676 RepID=UPI0026A00CD0